MAIRMCGGCTTEQMNGGGGCVTSVESFAGAVLGTYERNGYDDSDFYAIVWDGERIRAVEYASTRGWTYHNGAGVDATPDVIAAARAYMVEKLTARWLADNEAELTTAHRGAVVRSLTTRGKNVGVTGAVGWLRTERGRYGLDETRVGIDTPDRGRVFMDADRVEVVTPSEGIRKDPAEVRRAAQARANDNRWRDLIG